MRGRELSELYASFGRAFSRMEEWSAYVITSCPSFERDFGRRADRVRVLYNSELECRFYRFLGAPPARRAQDEDVAGRGEDAKEDI